MSGSAAVERRVKEVSAVLYAHAGGIELDHVDEGGRVHVKFTGSCTGCPYRPVTMATTIRPGLLQIEGVTGVEATGSRISEEAERRLAEDLDTWWQR
jgi:Fe-S cluster biogenesis protein NfuA